MKTKPACGPQRDPEFFEEIDKLFAKYPEAASRYAVSCLRLETVVLKIDFERQVGVSRVEDGRIITEFHDRDDDIVRLYRHTRCCQYVHGYECVRLCPIDE
ncbi:hypothetical protein [Streptomyces sp. NPDC057280]|uniref:hypothetical protein n=1 Tax=Streptomyces sp. NPDC057280 TaxID=3346081 RepID=UPI0009CF3A83|nr:hypothetical protein B1R27_36005 [Streptomyces sp. GKU 895]